MKQTNGRNLKKCDNGSRLSENIFLRKFQVHSTKKEEEKGGRWGRRGERDVEEKRCQQRQHKD